MAIKTQLPSETTRKVTLVGLNDIMFDRYAGDNKTNLTPEQKLYYGPDGKTVVLPAANILSLLTAQNTPSAPKRFLDSRSYKKVAQALLSYLAIGPQLIPLTRNGKPIVFNGFGDEEEDRAAGIYIHRCVARLDKGIPNPKVRPTVKTPWELRFDLTLFKNDDVGEEMVVNLLVKAGIGIGLGTYRGVFGKFKVEAWE